MTAVDPLIADATISQCEAGRYSPTARTLRLWAQALGMQPALVPIAYETAPAVPEIAAGNGATEGGHTFPSATRSSARPPDAPASAPVPDFNGDRADVARDDTCYDPQCGDSTWDHDCPTPAVPGGYTVTANGVTRRAVARTLDVAERTVGQAFAAGLSEMGTAMAAEVRRTHYSALPLLPPVERGPAHDPPPGLS